MKTPSLLGDFRNTRKSHATPPFLPEEGNIQFPKCCTLFRIPDDGQSPEFTNNKSCNGVSFII